MKFLFHKIVEIDEIIFDLNISYKIDFYISIMSLPFIFRSLKEIPKAYNFLPADEKNDEYWKKKIQKIQNYKVGLVWQGDRINNKSDFKRSVLLSVLDPIISLKNIQIISLQKDFGSEQINKNKYNKKINDFYGNIDLIPFKDTISIIKNLDLVISVDTSTAHISATLGKKTWLMLPFDPDFRWE